MPKHLIIDLNQTISKKLIKHRISISGFRLDKVFHCLGIRKPNCFIRFSFKATKYFELSYIKTRTYFA